MKRASLRLRIALWTVGVVAGALALFGAGAAWNLRKHLLENLDRQIALDARDFVSELNEQPLDWRKPDTARAFFNEEPGRFQYVEVRDRAGHLLFRTDTLGDVDIAAAARGRQQYNFDGRGRELRFGVFAADGIQFAIGRERKSVQEPLEGLFSAYLFALPLVSIVVGSGAWWIATRATAPVKTIAAQAEKISASDLHRRIPPPSSADEIGHLTVVLNAMFDRLERSFQQVTRFTSDASHELKTPIALMRAQIETALDCSTGSASQRELFSDLIDQCSQLSHVVDGLLFLSRADDRQLALQKTRVDLVAIVEDLREDAEILAGGTSLAIAYELPESLVIDADVRLLRRAVMNLIDNAIKYNCRGGKVEIRAWADHDQAVVSVRNTGEPIPPLAREKIFDRFYRSNSSRAEAHGHGLGLSIAREIARTHLGELRLIASDSRWTEFRLIMPVTCRSTSSSGEPRI